ncbi:hypothetical protein IMF27_18630 [Pseudomonas sp. PCH199]|uniref:hypothetical protein n=1 Tax=unclassified Pseudomonas TaxID=196821 RepID=UPI000BC8DBA1|nr:MULTISPECIES: hypothetical protein [unclassified Pseudomonas]MCW8277399.1 hypothetical protein [Pseudomonas sp. PCH199]PAM82337.1 hypothetical protein CES87_18995 [Pseudomonas sp. ERMR1:02]
MNISTLCLLGSLLVSAGACANGIIPVLELDFTRSATEILKKHGINDACIIAASNPGAFTYCREGSPTLWKYQALDLNLQASALTGTKTASVDNGRITLVEADSIACEPDTSKPLVNPAITRTLALGLIVLFLLIGLRHTYRATMDGFFVRTAYSGTHMPRSTGSFRSNRSTTKALGAFAIAAAVAFIYFGYGAFLT